MHRDPDYHKVLVATGGSGTSVSGLEQDLVACGVIADVDGAEGSLASGPAQDARVPGLEDQAQNWFT